MFRNLHVTPFYGPREAILQWKWDGPEGLPVAVYKSPSGLPDTWKMLDQEGNASVGVYLDTEGPMRDGAFAETWYRVSAWNPATQQYTDSQPVSLLEQLPRERYILLRRFLQQQYVQMRLENGFQVFHIVRARDAEVSPAVDPVTDQVTNTCADPEAMGQRYSPGYASPCPTFISVPTPLSRKTSTAEAGMGENTDIKFGAVMLAWPTPSEGDLIVHPATDRRWIITSPEIRTEMFLGIYPCHHQVEISLLPLADRRYKLELPELPALPSIAKLI